jgi:hypothetical protein
LMKALAVIRTAVLLGMITGWASAQTFPFQLRITSSSGAAVLADGSTIGFSAALGQTTTIRLIATYNGFGTATFPQIPQVFGSTDFTATLAGTPPITLTPGANVIVDIQYAPTTATGANAQFNLPFTETITTTNPATVNQNQISLNLQGTSDSFVLSYVLQSTLNTVPLPPGGTIPFPNTVINTTFQANLNITNVGSGTGRVTSVVITGSPAFTISGEPLFPANVAASQTLPLLLLYKPTAVESDSAQIQISFDSGAPVTINLQGSGVSPMYSYTVIQGGQTTMVTPPGPITMPDTNVGGSNNVVIQVQNTGNSNGTITSAPTVTGPFQISNLQTVFPQVLPPNNSFTFTLTFMPTQPGSQTGQLLIGSDLFTVSGNGLGASIVFSYGPAGNMTTIGSNGSVIFSPTQVSQASMLNFTISNTGTTTAMVSNIAIGESNSPFSLSNPPNLPTSLGPGQSVQFGISFMPTTIGLVNGTLHIDTTTIQLVGSGTTPPPLPTYTINGPSGNVSAQSQPVVSLTLSNPYPVALTGVLTLTTSGSVVSDPAVQFSTSGRNVAFTIPANTTQANFANQGPLVGLQTGTVASTITLTPSFATQAGGVNLTPNSPSTLQFTVAQAAPVLIAVAPGTENANGFQLNVIGYATTRALTSLTVQFTAVAGKTLGNSQATVNVQPAATIWFQSSASQALGGEFEVTLPFTLQGSVPTGQTLLQMIASVSVTATNAVGTSNSVTTTLP